MIAEKLRLEMKLRDPQYDSLQQLEEVLQRHGSSLKKNYTESELASIFKSIFRKTGHFDYSFPSYCFALATGVGKTRLLGACIHLLHKRQGFKNFFVIAPNKTIYDKFIREFDERDDKYIFEGITDLPKYRVFTGEDFNRAKAQQSTLWSESFTVYIFNIDKFKSEERVLQTKKIDEYLGESFYQYLSSLPDLIVLMDESHKYKTPIAINAVNGLKPVLGLEFTATPFKKITENEKTGKFENILYEYPLGAALAADNPVLKRPQLLLRKDFNYDALTKKERYDIMLTDGLDNHERVKTKLQAYFDNEGISDEKRFLPLILVVCEDIRHAINLEQYLKTDFLDGKYKDRIVRIHSTPADNKDLPKEEKYNEDTEIEKLLELEKVTNRYEIVINVNKLGLGWDVKNVYTIVPLRAFDSQVFVEQTIGRGLRLPFGKWIEDEELNKLRVAYHSNFGTVIERADAWLRNIEVVELPKRRMVSRVLKPTNKDMAILIPVVKPKLHVDFKLEYFEPKTPSKLEEVEVSIIVKDLTTHEEKEIGTIKEKLEQSPIEYILSKLIDLPHLSVTEIPVLERIVDKYLESLGKKGHHIGLENRLQIVSDLYEQIKERIGEKTSITYEVTDEKIESSEYEATFEAGFKEDHYEKWDDEETKRGLVSGYRRSLFSENVFDSRQERMVAKILENEKKQVIKWFRPYKKENFSIVYHFKGEKHDYIPDFVVETKERVYIIEPKSKQEIEAEITKVKVRAALAWIREVNSTSGKLWEFCLIPHDRINSSVTSFAKLLNQSLNLAQYLKDDGS